MLIVSQSREAVVNFNNCVKIELGKYSTKNCWTVDAYTTTDTIVELGQYEYYTSALETLTKIAECEGACNVFYMPEESINEPRQSD